MFNTKRIPNAILTILCVVIGWSSLVNAQDKASPFFPDEQLMPVGAYYYPEHWSPDQWERDLKKMAELGFEFTHFGEFAWAMMEPEEGVFDFEWLDKNVELAAKYGLKVIMCTPTPTPPAWLTEKHPEVLCVGPDGITQRHANRLHANGTNRTYQFYSGRIVKELAKRYGKDERIIGWQVDNEPHFSTLYDYSPHARTEFQVWLKNKYKNIDALNKAWGTPFWSQVYNDFNQIRIPNAKEGSMSSPHAVIDFNRYNAEAVAAALRFQSKILKENIDPKQWVTTNFAYYKFLPSVDLFESRGDFDFTSHTMYLLSTYLNYPKGDLAHRLGSGMELSFSNEMANSIEGYTGIMELQPGQINWGAYNSQPLPGAVRMWIWHSFGLGDKFTCTYRFRQPIYGGELYHKGIMETDGVTVARGGKEYVQALEEIKSLRDKFDAKAKEPKDYAGRRVGFLWKQSNLYDLENQKHNNNWDTWQHFYTYYEDLKSLGSLVDFLAESDDFDPKKHPFIVAPSYSLVDEALVSKWQRYVENGGHLILSVRTGQKDNNGHLWEALLQEPIWKLIGAKIDFYDHLPPGKNGSIGFDGKSYAWNVWGDALIPDAGTEVWGKHEDQFYKGTPCITHKKSGKGTVTYIGTWSNERDLERDVLKKVMEKAGAKPLDQKRYVFTEWRSGFWVTVNYTSETIEAPIPDGAEILIGEKSVAPGQVVVWKD